MASFRDRLGRDWDVNITTSMLPKLRAAGFNVGLVGRDAKAFDVLEDPEKLGDVLGVLCGDQIEKLAITPQQFADGFDGPTIYAACDAITEAVADFSQRPAVAKAVKARLPGAMSRLETAAIEQWEKALDKIGSPTPSGSNSGPGNSPASPDSTPAG